RLLPSLPLRFTKLGKSYRAAGKKRGHVALLAGCIMGTAYAPVNAATIRVLARNGFEVSVPARQICCGALSVHAGERAIAKAMAKRNIEAFEAGGGRHPVARAPMHWGGAQVLGGDEPILVNAAGCGVAMKEYGDLL